MERQVSDIREESMAEVSRDDANDISIADFDELNAVKENGDASSMSNYQDSPQKTLIQGQAVLDKMKQECLILQTELEKARTERSNTVTPEKLEDTQSSRKTELLDLKAKVRIKPTTYDGTSPWNDYAVQFEMLAEMNGWDERTQALYLAASLRGAAQAILGDLDKDRRRNYKALVKALSSRFGSDNQQELFRVQLKNRQRKREETLPELAQAVRRLVRLAYSTASYDLQETLSKEHFIDALCDTEVRWRVFQSKPANLDDAVRIAVELEAFKAAERQRDVPFRKMARVVSSEQDEKTKTDQEIDGLKNKIAGMSTEISKMTETMSKMLRIRNCVENNGEKQMQQSSTKNDSNDRQNWDQRRKYRQTVVCWNCNENGHFSRECPKPKQQTNYHQTRNDQRSWRSGKKQQPTPWSDSRLGNRIGRKDQQ